MPERARRDEPTAKLRQQPWSRTCLELGRRRCGYARHLRSRTHSTFIQRFPSRLLPAASVWARFPCSNPVLLLTLDWRCLTHTIERSPLPACCARRAHELRSLRARLAAVGCDCAAAVREQQQRRHRVPGPAAGQLFQSDEITAPTIPEAPRADVQEPVQKAVYERPNQQQKARLLRGTSLSAHCICSIAYMHALGTPVQQHAAQRPRPSEKRKIGRCCA